MTRSGMIREQDLQDGEGHGFFFWLVATPLENMTSSIGMRTETLYISGKIQKMATSYQQPVFFCLADFPGIVFLLAMACPSAMAKLDEK